eukprot:1629446-Rhodomonas_salina.2
MRVSSEPRLRDAMADRGAAVADAKRRANLDRTRSGLGRRTLFEGRRDRRRFQGWSDDRTRRVLRVGTATLAGIMLMMGQLERETVHQTSAVHGLAALDESSSWTGCGQFVKLRVKWTASLKGHTRTRRWAHCESH